MQGEGRPQGAPAQPGLGGGAVVNLLDQKLANPNPDFFSYSLTKYALAGATEMMAPRFDSAKLMPA